MEVVSTLINISEAADLVTGDTADHLSEQLSVASFPQDDEIMHDVKSVRRAYDKSHWWWWPEKAKKQQAA